MPGDQRYVSSELTHFVGRGRDPEDQYRLLIHILKSGWLTHPPHNPHVSGNLSVNTSAALSTNEMYSPQIVCFCDIPVEDLHIHTTKYSRFGFSLSKDLIVRQGGRPVLYCPRTALIRVNREIPVDQMAEVLANGDIRDLLEEIPLGEFFDRMVPEYQLLMHRFRDLVMQARQLPGVPDEFHRLLELQWFLDFCLISYVKFFDHSLQDHDPDNYYMEREWRVIGNVRFILDDVRRIFIPCGYAKRLRSDLPDFAGQLTYVE